MIDKLTYVRSFRPDWQHVLELQGEAHQPGTFVFKVSLDADLWRQVIMPDSSTLVDLSDAILHAYGFDHDYLYRFVFPSRFGTEIEIAQPFMEQTPSVTEVTIRELPAQPDFRMLYNYDFGDNWRFDVVLVRIDPPEQNPAP